MGGCGEGEGEGEGGRVVLDCVGVVLMKHSIDTIHSSSRRRQSTASYKHRRSLVNRSRPTVTAMSIDIDIRNTHAAGLYKYMDLGMIIHIVHGPGAGIMAD